MTSSTTSHPENASASRHYFFAFVGLMLLLGLTTGLYYVDLGNFNYVAGVVIALVKACIVLFIFMHVKASPWIVWLFALAGFWWLLLMVNGIILDDATRPLDPPFSHQTVVGVTQQGVPGATR